MNELTTYRVTRLFLVNLAQQAFYGAVGVVVSWGLFWELSQFFLAAPDVSTPAAWIRTPYLVAAQLGSVQDREFIRCLVGPLLAVAVLAGGLADLLTWVFVRYEVRADKLVMRWWWWSRSIAWDVVQQVQERPQTTNELRSLVISATGVPPILVRGLGNMPEFCETVRSRISLDAEWTPTPYRIDLTSRSTNLAIGLLLPIPFHATWLAGYVGGLSLGNISLIWAWIAVMLAGVAWYWRPMSRRHLCAVEIELAIAALLLLLSGLLTMLSWLESPTGPPWARILW